MNRTIEFKVFCLEAYKSAHKVNGANALNTFKKYGVFNYISSFYDVLHSTGQQYIIEDIDLYIEARQPNGLQSNWH